MAGAREIAWQVLNRCDASEQYSNIALDTAIRRSALGDADRGLLTALVYGTLERRMTLDACIASLSDRPVGEIAPEVRNLLRMGLYQLLYLERVPDHAAVYETVSLAPRRARGFVNALLRGFLRTGKQIPLPPRGEDPVRYLSVYYSVGEALCRRLLSVFGEERTESILSAFGEVPPLTLRVNTLRTDRDSLLAALSERGVAAEATRESLYGIRILDKRAPASLYGFAEGLFFVQDEASQLCVEALDVREGMQVLDTCACPGSKSFGAAMMTGGTGSVLSCDLHANKLSLVESGAARLGIGNLSVLARDGGVTEPAFAERFDRVLCDVPCSGFGVLAKKPELRYKDPAASERLPAVQGRILDASAGAVRRGGKLVYSTCTLLPEENGERVRAFLRDHSEFSLLSERTLFPDTDGTDGFFFAVMQKN